MKDIETNQSYNGFRLEKKEFIKELDSTVYLFKHEVLDVPILAIKNNDDNKTFSISFQTVPEDSTGVAHILEHSVLMGSKKYPIKDVFGEINKGGLMTFLNAMTGSDVTYYPFATRNINEYFNIMDVYCDVVLNPQLLPSTFEQEGWHYHKENEKQPLEFQGVVFNEMKGAFSDPIRALFHHTYKELMPESTYIHESGGDPKNIPDLTYEQFVSFHRHHYHPSNAAIYFYGNAPLEQELDFIQNNYLIDYKSNGAKVSIKEGRDITKPSFVEETYTIQPGSELDGKTFLAVSSVIGSALDRKLNTAFRIISNILYNSDASPLKDAMLSSNICKDFGGLFLYNSSIKTVMMTYVVGSDPQHLDTLLKLYHEVLSDMVEQGLDHNLVTSELNKFEFSVREEMNKAQRGLNLINKTMPSLKYGGDPFEALQINSLLAELRVAALENNYFEQLIKEYLLDAQARVVITLKPDPQKGIQTVREEKERLERHEKGLNEKSLCKLIEHTKDLSLQQHQANSEEQLALLPHLRVDDLNRTLDFHKVRPETMNKQPFLISEVDTNGISYMEFGFDCTGLDVDLLRYLDLYGVIACEIGTLKKPYMEFAKEINITTGGFSHSFSTHLDINDPQKVRPILWFHTKTLSHFQERALELVTEVFSEINFGDKKHIREIILREYAWAEHSIQSEGYGMAVSRAFSHLGEAGKYNDCVTGVIAYQTLKELATDYDKLEEKFLTNLHKIHNLLLRRNNITFAIAGRESDITSFSNSGKMISSALSDAPAKHIAPNFHKIPNREGFCTSAEVVFNILACKLLPDNTLYNGHFEVLKAWLSRDYLWNTVRQIGGAY
ncbi:MAG: insulinase family protein, partial [Desulfobulbaceae bacterium]|nr:insulinase family protein [Desulfobulbaceae bacterium]